ncbi:P-loop containing nucleoside triphosphate hydrolase protein [Daldinia caldariorum]|uniref:P-loop containing nucleoside triphosphate hydrolase protein n=1 Tax=Daldinia caldariorum TaxID=326644 RepID=UPI002007E051|nr:P-loop containing nucleoside triphosphate hydrolase protein [Daldinia caldariorum]KAI1464926.1 P-loop containing nucleoside triphosphate hydrolase protein [Daldinia caldariorum]
MAAEGAAVPLQSKDHKTLMDIIDKLRSKGINRYVNLPQIVVCGDQSSGKSSVLQAISGMTFPTKDSLCTRFATELILRHTNEHTGEKCCVSISPGDDRSPKEKALLEKFQYSEIPGNFNIGTLVDKAKEAMGVGIDKGRTFCKDILRIELSGPAQPHLTIVDLPGLFRAGNKEQSTEDAAIVQSLVLSYMRNPRSIILAVVSAQSNFALQEVTQHAREIDIRGERTLGLITKPDTLDVGSASERDYFDLVQNRDVKFRLGWHVVRNRDFKSRDCTNEERDQAEAEFFDQGVWAGLPRSHKGSASLRTRLSEVLKEQILEQLPDVLEEIQRGLDQCSSQLEKLGVARSTLAEQRKYLLSASHQFSNLITEAKDGFYQNKFFGNVREDAGYRKRLRAVVQNTLTDFAQIMQTDGEARKIVESASKSDTTQVSRADYLLEVKDLMRRSRGCELPGTYNPLIIGGLFREQCKPWRKWLESFSRDIFEAVDLTVNDALSYIVGDDTKAKLWGELISDGLEKLNRQLHDKVDEILRPHEDGHPITYNHYLTENVQKIRTSRYQESIKYVLEEYERMLGVLPGTPEKMSEVITKLTERNMETVASSDAIDWMEAYYKVALKQVVDDFSKLAIEACLISNLPGLFTPEVVFELTDDTIRRIAAESWETADERRFLTEKMSVLSSGMKELQRLSKYHNRIGEKQAKKVDYVSTPASEREESWKQETSELSDHELLEESIHEEEASPALLETATPREKWSLKVNTPVVEAPKEEQAPTPTNDSWGLATAAEEKKKIRKLTYSFTSPGVFDDL